MSLLQFYKLYAWLALLQGGLSTADIQPRDIRPSLWSESISTNVSRGPYDIDPAVWANLMEKNQVAWGDFPVIGPDTRQIFPGTEKLNWTLSIDIATNISLKYSNTSLKPPNFSSDIPYNYSAYISGAALSLHPPSALFNGTGAMNQNLMDPSWKVCAYTYDIGVIFSVDRDRGLPPNACDRISNSKCLDAVSQDIHDSISRNEWDSDSGCPRITSLPPGRRDDQCPQYGTAFSIPIKSFSWSSNKTHAAFSQWDIASSRDRLEKLEDVPDVDVLSGKPAYYNGSALFQWASDSGDKGNLSLLDDVGQIVPVFLLWAYDKDRASVNANSTSLKLDFQCVKAEHKAGYLDHIPGSATHRFGSVTRWYWVLMITLIPLI